MPSQPEETTKPALALQNSPQSSINQKNQFISTTENTPTSYEPTNVVMLHHLITQPQYQLSVLNRGAMQMSSHQKLTVPLL